MTTFSPTIFELQRLDDLAYIDSPIHRLDPRAKLLATQGCILAVVSFPKYEVVALMPFLAFPLLLAAFARVPLAYLAGKTLLALPFAAMVGLANPFLDRQTLFQLGPLAVSGGWISFCSILLRCTITVTAALTLIATTGMNEVCLALERLKVPRVFVIQLLFLYRYLFVLLDESNRLQRARQVHTPGWRGLSLRVAGQLICQLLLRSLDRAQRIYLAMRCRGFDGEIRRLAPLCFSSTDAGFLFGCLAAFTLLRGGNLPHLLN